MAMTKDVSVVGPLNIDLLISGEGPADWASIPTWDGPADMEMTAAGSVGYTVSNMAKLGLKVRVASCVPADPLGEFIVSALQRSGVDTGGVQMIPGTVSGIGVYMLLFGSRKRPLAYRLPTHDPWPQRFSPKEIERLLAAHLLHNGGYLHFRSAWHGTTRDIFRLAKARGLVTTMDPQFPLFAMDPPWVTALEDILPSVDYLFCDETEARKLTALEQLDAAAVQLLAMGPHTIVVKQGADGATVYRDGWQHHQPAVTLGEVVDSIGAGDTFDAAFILGLLEGWRLERCARFAAIAAGFTVTGVGGTATMPDRAQIEAVLNEDR